MRKAILVLSALMLFSSNFVFAQTNEQKNTTVPDEPIDQRKAHFLDAQFHLGEILFKTGEISYQKLNYHLGANAIGYIADNGKFLILNNLENVLVVRYADREFYPIGKTEIAEAVKTFDDDATLLLQREAKLSGPAGPYGGNTITGSATSLTTMPDWGVFDPLNPTNIPAPEITERYLLLEDGNRHKLTKISSLRKVYKSKWKEIKEYDKEHKPSFKNQQDLIDLLEFVQ